MRKAKEFVTEIFGINRDLSSDEKNKVKVDYNDPMICSNFLVLGFCPYRLFRPAQLRTNKCMLIHDQTLRSSFLQKPISSTLQIRQKTLRNLKDLVQLVDKKVETSLRNMRSSRKKAIELNAKDVLLHLEGKATETKKELEKALETKDISLVGFCTNQLNALDEYVEKIKNRKKGQLVPYYLAEQLETKKLIDLGTFVKVPAAAVCKVCSAFVLENDITQRVLSHLTGSFHASCVLLRYAEKKLEKELINQ